MPLHRRSAPVTRPPTVRTSRRWTRWLLVAVLCAVSSALVLGDRRVQDARRERRAAGPLSPTEALASFQLEAGYRVELAAAEPLIKDPVAMAFDDRGRMFVVENRGYPGPLEGADAGAAAEGVIALLEDTNRDGRFDKRTDFARQLTFPNGIMPWDGGVFVSCAPDLIYLKDTDNDGVADERRVVFTGFDVSKTSQLRFSHPTLGLDNWVYLTSGLNGGRVTAPDQPERSPVTLGTNDSRFNPLTLAFEVTGGQGQYGLTFDDYGRRFTCSNRRPVMHVVLEAGDLKRNPHLAFSQTVEDVSAAGAQAAVWPISGDTTTASFIPSLMSAPHAGTFTAASGVHIHRGNALPAADRGSIFVCESAQNLVQRQIMTANGVTFTSRPARTGRDFLSSRDTWFRPVFAANGPDGALYIVDMYRRIIDHPQYVPEQSRALLDFQAGKERGRIYRIVAAGWKRDRRPIDLGGMSTPELAATLEHPNAWWRETAQRLIVERRDRTAIPHVRVIAQGSHTDVARLHALWTLDGLDGLEVADVAAALQDPHAAVRENAVRLAGSRIGDSEDLLTGVVGLVNDPDDRVRLQVALALSGANDPRAISALAVLARRDGAQQWMRAAILSSVRDRANDFLRAFVESPASSSAVKAAVMQDVGQLFGAAEIPERCLRLIAQIGDPSAEFGWQPAALLGVAQGLRARGLGSDSRSAFMTLLTGDAPEVQAARERMDAMLSRGSALALDGSAPLDQRLAVVGLLGHTDDATAGETLARLLSPQQPADVQVAAVRATVQLRDRTATSRLIEASRWQGYTAQLREAVLSALVADDQQVAVLLDAVEQGTLAAHVAGSVAAQPPDESSRRDHPEACPGALRRRRVRRSDAGLRADADDVVGTVRERR